MSKYNVKIYFVNGFTHLEVSANGESNALIKAIKMYEKSRLKYNGGSTIQCAQIVK